MCNFVLKKRNSYMICDGVDDSMALKTKAWNLAVEIRHTYCYYVMSGGYKKEITVNCVVPSPIISLYWFFKSCMKASVVIYPSETYKSAGKLNSSCKTTEPYKVAKCVQEDNPTEDYCLLGDNNHLHFHTSRKFLLPYRIIELRY